VARQPQREPFGDTCQGDLRFLQSDGSALKPDAVSLFPTPKLPKGAQPLHAGLHARLPLACGGLDPHQQSLGHVNPHVTATVYVHALPGRDGLAAAAWQSFQNAGDR
jgi:hypothetical protein